MANKPRKKFLRRFWNKFNRLGRRRKKERKWRKSKGMHNKMREQRKGYSSRPEIGMKKPLAGKQEIKIIRNLKELLKIRKGEQAIISRKIGKKKRQEIENKAGELGIKILNLK